MATLTREVLNQAPPLVDFNPFDAYPALGEALEREGGGWADAGNVAALDVLRAIAKEPEGLPAFLGECRLAAGTDAHFDDHMRALESAVATGDAQWNARRTVEDLALALQASLLLRHAPPAVGDAFCASRLGRDGGHAYGTLPATTDFEGIVERAWRHHI